MHTNHDPYLNAVQRSLHEEKFKLRQKKKNLHSIKSKSFLSKSIHINDYIHLPEGLEKLFLLNIFIFIPYLFGIFFMFIILKQESLQEHQIWAIDSFMLTWSIGYEFIAFLLLVAILKNAFTFKTSSN